jgi:hypothetical protein
LFEITGKLAALQPLERRPYLPDRALQLVELSLELVVERGEVLPEHRDAALEQLLPRGRASSVARRSGTDRP